MVILRTRNKITDFLMLLAWVSPFNQPRSAISQPSRINTVSMLAYHLQRWPNINIALVQRIVLEVGSCTRRSQTALDAG